MLSKLGNFRPLPANEVVYEGACVLIYGPPGGGKTTLAAGMADDPDNHDVLDLDAEGGAKSLKHRSDVEILPSASWRETNNILTALEREQHNYKGLIVDNLSEIQRQDGDSISPSGVIEWTQYNSITAHSLKLARRLRDLAEAKGMTIIVIGWEGDHENQQTGIKKRIVGLNPAAALKMPGIFDVVGYLTPETKLPNNWRHLILGESAKTDTKMRRGLDDMAQSIPGDVYYEVRSLPTADLLAALKGVRPFPADKYKQPIKAAAQQSA